MESIIPVYKPICWTPLKAVNVFKEQNVKYLGKKISYAGRLDPMAEGILLLLIGDENKNRKKYESLKKNYTTEVILGIGTDTFDPLGLITDKKLDFKTSDSKIAEVIESFKGKGLQKYPPYSSKTVEGKPLYWWARQNKLGDIEIPEREIEIHSIKAGRISTIRVADFYKKISAEIKDVEGNFRQEEIIKSWKELLTNSKDSNILKIDLEISCSSGTYIRRLVSDLGDKLNCPALAHSIKRTKLGNFTEKDCTVLK